MRACVCMCSNEWVVREGSHSSFSRWKSSLRQQQCNVTEYLDLMHSKLFYIFKNNAEQIIQRLICIIYTRRCQLVDLCRDEVLAKCFSRLNRKNPAVEFRNMKKKLPVVQQNGGAVVSIVSL